MGGKYTTMPPPLYGDSRMNQQEIDQMMRAMNTVNVGNTDMLGSISNPFRQTYPSTMTPAGDISVDSWRMRAIAMRLRIPQGSKHPFQHLSTAWTGEKVFVFVVENDQAVVLEDGSALFPSDTLVTQLRLIQK